MTTDTKAKLIYQERREIHPRGGHEYSTLFIMERDGELRLNWYHDSFAARAEPDYRPDEWDQAGIYCEQRETAAELLDQGYYPGAEQWLRKIASA